MALSLVDLGEKKLRACFQEHREQVLHGENSLQVVVRFIQTSKEVEDEGLVGDRFAEVHQRIHHGMKTTTVVGAGYVALKEGVELGGEVDGAKLGVAKELVLEVALDDHAYDVGDRTSWKRSAEMVPESQVSTTQSIFA